MKKITLITVLAFASSGAFAASQTICSAPNGGGNGTAIVPASPANFVQVQFTPKCSSNVFLNYDESATAAWVGSASKKGKNYFKGSTAGGGVTVGGACASTAACAAADAASGLTAAASIS